MSGAQNQTNPYGKINEPGAPFMSEAERAYLTEIYHQAKIILEYGSGGSTRIASQMPGKLIFSVESDLDWALSLQTEIDASNPLSPATVYPVDIGAVGPWGRPLGETQWRKFQRYPTAIWDEPFFRHPDVVLIDGRMRTACLSFLMMRIEKPVTVLFDDYGARKLYQHIEKIIKPKEIIGTLAHFELEPDSLNKQDLAFAIGQFSLCSVHPNAGYFYRQVDPL